MQTLSSLLICCRSTSEPKKDLQAGGQIITFALKEEPEPESSLKMETASQIEQLVFYLETLKKKIVIKCEDYNQVELIKKLKDNTKLKERVSC